MCAFLAAPPYCLICFSAVEPSERLVPGLHVNVLRPFNVIKTRIGVCVCVCVCVLVSAEPREEEARKRTVLTVTL